MHNFRTLVICSAPDAEASLLPGISKEADKNGHACPQCTHVRCSCSLTFGPPLDADFSPKSVLSFAIFTRTYLLWPSFWWERSPGFLSPQVCSSSLPPLLPAPASGPQHPQQRCSPPLPWGEFPYLGSRVARFRKQTTETPVKF